MRRFERPDAPLQPVEQRQIVGAAAKQRLTQVDVGLDESRQETTLGGVDHCYVIVTAGRSGIGAVPGAEVRADVDNHPVAHEHTSALDDLPAVVHGEDGGVADEEDSRAGFSSRPARDASEESGPDGAPRGVR